MFPTLRRGSWDPFSSLQRELNRAFDRAWPEEQGDVVGAYPVDIRETEDRVVVEAELPGFDKKDIDITLENGVLTIQAARADKPDSENNGKRHLNERRFTRVARSFTLPQTVDEQNVEATLDGGVLTLTLNKQEQAKTRKIEVK
jgi:HSP20 family protein